MSTNTKAEPSINQAESDFVDAYERTSIEKSELLSHFQTVLDILDNKSAPPTNDVVINYEIHTRPDFSTKGVDIFPKSCFVTTVYIGRLLNDMNILIDSSAPITRSSQQIQNNTNFAENFQELDAFMNQNHQTDDLFGKYYLTIKAAIALFFGRQDYIQKYYTADLLEYLKNYLLVQKLVCQSRIFQIVLETYAKIFVKRALEQAKPQIRAFNEKKISQKHTSKDEKPPYHEILVFLQFVTTIGNLWQGTDYAAFFYENGSDYIHDSRESIPPPLFCGIVDCCAMMCRTPELARKIMSSIAASSSEIIKFTNFIEAIHGHALDLGSCDIERKALSVKDAYGMESVLKFLAAIARQDPSHFRIENTNNGNQDKIEHKSALHEALNRYKDKSLTLSLVQIILSSVPATLKGCCFELLAEISSEYNADIWTQLEDSKILTSDIIKSRKGGILTEIETIENKAGIYPITRNFIRCLASLLKHGAPKERFDIYHDFLNKIVLSNHTMWLYTHISDKWGILTDLAQCWINLIVNEKTYKEFVPRIRDDQELIKMLLNSLNDEDAPLETLYTNYKFFLILSEKSEKLDSHSVSSIEEQLGWNTATINKILRCTACIDRDLQRISIHLLQRICLTSPTVAQVIISKENARAIDVIKYVIDYDESEDEDEEGILNIRCSMLTFLLSLGSDSFFLRHVCGFSLHDPPLSILQSSLDGGILTTILDKLHKYDTHMHSPKFTELSFKLLLLLTESALTIGPTLSLLLSWGHSFFVDQLLLLRDDKCMLSSIGCYLQLLARAAAMNTEAIFSGPTQQAFNSLLTSISGDGNAKRNIMILGFIDRIDGSDDALAIALGVKEVCVNFFANEHAVGEMMKTTSTWILSWIMFVITILEHIPKLNSQRSQKQVQILSESAACIAHVVFGNRIFTNIEDSIYGKVFSASITCLLHLVDSRNASARAGIYSIIDAVVRGAPETIKEEFIQIFSIHETQVLEIIKKDSNEEIPIIEAGAMSVAESLIKIASPFSFIELISSAIREIEDDWRLFRSDDKACSFVIKSKCSFFTRFIATVQNPKLMKVFIEDGVVAKLSYEEYWRNTASVFSTCTKKVSSEQKLIMGSSILKLFSTLAAALQNNEDAKRHITCFIKKFKDPIVAVLNFESEITNVAIEFIADVICLVSIVPGLERSINNPVVDRIPFVFRRFLDLDGWTTLLKVRSDSIDSRLQQDKIIPQEILDDAKKIVQKLLRCCITFLVRRTDAKLLFAPPLVGDEWRTSSMQKRTNDVVPLSVVTSYATQLLRDDADKYTKTIASMCLVIIWRHLLVWSGEGVDFDVSTIRSQAKIFSENPFKSAQQKGEIDSAVLKKIVAFHATNNKV